MRCLSVDGEKTRKGYPLRRGIEPDGEGARARVEANYSVASWASRFVATVLGK